MLTVRIVGWFATVAMAAAIVFGFVNGEFADQGSAIWALAWGKVTLIDLYVGIVIFGAWVAIRESSWARIVLWWAALIVLGNFAAGVYVVRSAMLAEDLPELLLGESR